MVVGCHNQPALPAKAPVAVRLADVISTKRAKVLRYSASLVPYSQVDVAFRTTGYITEVSK